MLALGGVPCRAVHIGGKEGAEKEEVSLGLGTGICSVLRVLGVVWPGMAACCIA